ncbi:hypothetical protein J2S40_003321 [Nocardioides luteus]|uniref:DUF4333 domain-containing protein n=1 Tax=Nocardioides luteus TaxID=1844 RepID=A0ABQ5SXH5_9ACTN|nr:DUF4333 domain-containing protein [Nocardioides luteus]MDR7312263.1 hypothetical protein [Nocardioides luteus]GGR57098.1 hypothetical protein GCM10010197_24870 [Nocardioides luteus]GLJ68509.1 hypothetical protein GCM10017579_25450 [Nocardioides luteus]
MTRTRAFSGATTGAALLVLFLSLTACGSTRDYVQEKTVERIATEQLTNAIGVTPENLDCPGDLEGKVGTEMTCVLTSDGEKYDAIITVDDVDGGRVHFKIDVPPNAAE